MIGKTLIEGDCGRQIYSGTSFLSPESLALHEHIQPTHLSSVLAFEYLKRNLISSVSQEIVWAHISSPALD